MLFLDEPGYWDQECPRRWHQWFWGLCDAAQSWFQTPSTSCTRIAGLWEVDNHQVAWRHHGLQEEPHVQAGGQGAPTHKEDSQHVSTCWCTRPGPWGCIPALLKFFPSPFPANISLSSTLILSTAGQYLSISCPSRYFCPCLDLAVCFCQLFVGSDCDIII